MTSIGKRLTTPCGRGADSPRLLRNRKHINSSESCTQVVFAPQNHANEDVSLPHGGGSGATSTSAVKHYGSSSSIMPGLYGVFEYDAPAVLFWTPAFTVYEA